MKHAGRWIVVMMLSITVAACDDDVSNVPAADCCATPLDAGADANDLVIAEDGGAVDGAQGDVEMADLGQADSVAGDLALVDSSLADTSAQLCRNYASEFTDNNGKKTTCTFDATAIKLTCDKEGTKTYYEYPSVLLFIKEAHTVGRTTYTKRSSSTSSTAFVYTYDSQQRLTGFDHSSQATFYQHYSAWDSAGRPTAGVGSYDTTCTGYNIGFTYDDLKRTRYQQYSNIGMCPSSTYTFYHQLSTYDANGNVIKREFFNMSNQLTRTDTFTIVKTTQICL